MLETYRSLRVENETQIACPSCGAREWDDASYAFKLAMPEMAVCTFEFWDDDQLSGDDFLGQVSVPIAHIKIGVDIELTLLSASGALYDLGGAPTATVRFDLAHRTAAPDDVTLTGVV